MSKTDNINDISQSVSLYASKLECEWKEIPWHKIERSIFDLQQRIFSAEINKEYNKARNLQRILLNKDSTLLYSIRRVTQINGGKRTPGIDGMIILSDAERMALYYKLKERSVFLHKASPVRRVYIDKKNGKKRPLGIPTIIDRIYQMVVKLALEPRVEAWFEPCSYGFRPLRGVEHAIAKIHTSTKGHIRKWIFEGDFKSCFDTLNHDFIIKQLGNFPAKEVIKSWLEAGYLYNGCINITSTGTPQGGIISPVLANVALHGMEDALNIEYKQHTDKIGNINYHNTSKYIMIRYADDFVVICKTKEDAENIYGLLEPYLSERGLTLAEDKTRITHIDDGFDFLGFNIRNYHTQNHEKVLIKPSKKSISECKAKIRDVFVNNRGKSISKLIEKVNQIILGTAYYWRQSVAKKTFGQIDEYVWNLTKQYLVRQHPMKSWSWIRNKYLQKDIDPHYGYSYILTDPEDPKLQIIKMKNIHIRYGKQIKHDCSPYNKEYSDYIYNRWKMSPFECLYSKRH
ncbi:group II intron reverse transcriptase/maturase [Methanosphaera sp. ISO3-F5]|uniref:group II intron reverse transcriptase/maturase n=1 Tax=Methanosphaera sp. ISO3-F5 TaxID=1452353 RepID=UPI002B25AAEC|nr:group II intron reverse transcriptase/maturase [Methanosphaera sp. ISO3-F5]WQH63639.1 group II intron reverse transcriptase/maturase [Methanosphaera sp. ISO3-F5]